MDLYEKATAMLRALRAQGLTLDQALDQMRGEHLGAINIVKAIRTVEAMSLRDAVDLIERRGDHREY